MTELGDFPQLAINKICDQFEHAWKQQPAPDIGQFLLRATDPQRSALLEELLAIDIELRTERDGKVDPMVYSGLGSEAVKLARSLIQHRAVSDAATSLPANDHSQNARDSDSDTKVDADRVAYSGNRQIGPYKLFRVLGEGGMGAVWMAEQKSPVRRRVALKLIRPGLDNKQVIARFEAERQALAMMDHPHIAKVFDAGTTEAGQPYFVMEWVQGISFTDYCDQHRLSVRHRLELFIPVCRAVQHAHQKGIIHRDLKPSNVLVSLHDGVPVPKVIDFGLAKALQHQARLTDKSVFTEFGQVVGTLRYMSPEQAELTAVDIDTRTDIYSLGVMLYEILTGSTPIERETLCNGAILTVLETIRNREPVRPSVRLSNIADEAVSDISDQRRTDGSKLKSILRGDLDWIVMKALEKDRVRRYATANDLVEDIQRYLNDEAVQARPPSARYKFSKFVRKNRGLVTASTVIVVLLLAGIGFSLWFGLAAERARRVAVRQKQIADDTAKQVRLEKDKADRSAKRSADVLQIVTQSFKSADPHSGSDAQMSAKDVLINAQRSLKNSELDDEGSVILLESLTSSFFGLGEFDLATQTASEKLAIQERTLGFDHPDTLRSRNDLACVFTVNQQPEKAIPLLEPTLAAMKAVLGEDDPSVLRAESSLATAYKMTGRLTKAIDVLERTLSATRARLGPTHPDTYRAMGSLASAYKAADRLDEALPLDQQALAGLEAAFGEDHLDTLTAMNNLASAYELAGRLDEAIPLFEKTLELTKTKGGVDHPNTLTSMNNLACAYTTAGRFDEAIALHRQTVQVAQTKLGAEHPYTLASMANLADAYYSAARYRECQQVYEQVLPTMKAVLGPNHPDTLTVLHNLAAAYARTKDFEKSIPLFAESLHAQEALLGRNHPETQLAVAELGADYCDAGDYDAGIPLLEEAYQASAENEDLAWVPDELCTNYLRAGRTQKLFEMAGDELAQLTSHLKQAWNDWAGRLAKSDRE